MWDKIQQERRIGAAHVVADTASKASLRPGLDQESAAAERASSPEARQAHREMADRYSSKLELLESISSGTPYPATTHSTENQAA